MITLLKKKGINPQTKEVIYYPQWTRQDTIDERNLAKRMSRGGTYSTGEAMGVMMDFPAYIMDELMNGNAVSVQGLGSFKLKVNGKSRADKDKVTTAGVQAEIVFEPDADLRARLLTEAEFKFVDKPTPEGEQDVTGDEEEPTPTPEPETPAPDTGGEDDDEGGLAG